MTGRILIGVLIVAVLGFGAHYLTTQQHMREAKAALLAGQNAGKQRNYTEALAQFKKSVAAYPTMPAYLGLAAAHIKLSHYYDAVLACTDGMALAEKMHEDQKIIIQFHYFRGRAYSGQKKYQKCADDLAYCATIDYSMPDMAPNLYNAYAWLLATCPDAKVQNGALAVEYAEKATNLTSRRDPALLDTLAAA